MRKMRFYLRKSSSPKLGAIVGKLTYRVGYNESHRLEYYPRLSVKRSEWSRADMRMKYNNTDDHKRINKLLDNLVRWADDILEEFTDAGRLAQLTPDRFKRELERRRLNLRPQSADPLDYIAAHIQHVTERNLLHPNTVKILKTTERHLKTYFAYLGYSLGFDEWNKRELVDFVFFLQNVKEVKGSPRRLLNNNSANKVVKDGLFRFLRAAYDDGLHSNPVHLTKPAELGIQRNEPENIALTREEIERIRTADVRGITAEVRDLFVCACILGLRFGDWKQINRDNLITLPNGKPALQYFTTKGASRGDAKRVIIPVRRVVLEVIEKYNGHPPIHLNSVTNEELKAVARSAGLTQREYIKVNEAGQFSYKEFERWELVTTHTARRTAKTEMKRAALDREATKRLMGHSSDKMDAHYDKRTLEELAARLSESDYFDD